MLFELEDQRRRACFSTNFALGAGIFAFALIPGRLILAMLLTIFERMFG